MKEDQIEKMKAILIQNSTLISACTMWHRKLEGKDLTNELKKSANSLGNTIRCIGKKGATWAKNITLSHLGP